MWSGRSEDGVPIGLSPSCRGMTFASFVGWVCKCWRDMFKRDIWFYSDVSVAEILRIHGGALNSFLIMVPSYCLFGAVLWDPEQLFSVDIDCFTRLLCLCFVNAFGARERSMCMSVMCRYNSSQFMVTPLSKHPWTRLGFKGSASVDRRPKIYS